jgi:ribosomal protein S6--L-glutamate ligase
MGMEVINGSRSIADSRDKLRCLQILSRARLRVPPTVLNRSSRGLKAALQAVGGTPVVLKLIQGTQGVGVMLLQTPIAVKSVLDTIWGLEKDVILQQFIAEGAGRDYRAFVVGGQVVAAMMRTAPEGEFRSNIHRGGEGRLVRLPRSYKRAAIESARILGLDIAGVDLMEGPKGPLILEVNSSPGFEGIERATGLNIASQIIKHIVKKAQIARRRKKRRR